MDNQTAELILSKQALELLANISAEELEDEFELSKKLRKSSPPELVSACITQAKFRQRAEKKFGPFASRMLFSRDGLEQASRLSVSAQRANRFIQAGVESVVDLGCGIGGDSMAMAGLGINVTAVERDEVSSALAQFNTGGLGVEVINADAETIDLKKFDAVFADPARRRIGSGEQRNRLSPFEYTPPLDWLLNTVAKQKPTAIKLSPADDYMEIDGDFDFEWVSVAGELVEMSVYSGSLRGENIRQARLLTKAGNHVFGSKTLQSPIPEVSKVERYIHEPDSALIRSGLMGEFAIEKNLKLIDKKIAYLTSAELITSPWLKTYEIEQQFPLDIKILSKELAKRDIGILEIKKRGVDITPEELRKKLKLKGKGAASLIVTKRDDTRIALLGKPIH
ncbi:MAG: class I SAM-dependent methyltransferase [Microbacteriaceae bacterium]|nr:class I SAM-dependent methyltransferase [Microbacteriaceae bacterium]